MTRLSMTNLSTVLKKNSENSKNIFHLWAASQSQTPTVKYGLCNLFLWLNKPLFIIWLLPPTQKISLKTKKTLTKLTLGTHTVWMYNAKIHRQSQLTKAVLVVGEPKHLCTVRSIKSPGIPGDHPWNQWKQIWQFNFPPTVKQRHWALGGALYYCVDGAKTERRELWFDRSDYECWMKMFLSSYVIMVSCHEFGFVSLYMFELSGVFSVSRCQGLKKKSSVFY